MAFVGMSQQLGLNQAAHQKLAMTPELRQAIKILGLPSDELADYLSQQALDNPLLEVEDEVGQPEQFEQPERPAEGEREEPDWDSYFSDGRDLGYAAKSGSTAEPHLSSPEPKVEPTGYEMLLLQLGMVDGLSGEVRRAARVVIWSLDKNGYLPVSLDELAEATGEPKSLLEAGLEAVQALEPAGVGARNLSECLRLQADRAELSGRVRALIDHHLEDLAKGRIKSMLQKLNCDEAELREAVAALRTLAPYPGLSSSTASDDEIRHVLPDVVVRRDNGRWLVRSNDAEGPRLSINAAYVRMLSDPCADPETVSYVRRKMADAVRLIKSVEQRRQTVLKVAAAIVARQEDFMLAGPRFLVPMTLKDIAQDVGVHESTVSRATNGKYIDTPKGVFEMKYFFTSGVGAGEGSEASSASVKKRLRELVAAEDRTAPMSDIQLAAVLGSEGVRISRRTVAKYRDELKIRPSTLRRMC